jgi:PAS domain S-box-containing protein
MKNPLVLLVDDDADVRRRAGQLLEDHGCTIGEAGTAEEAIDMIRGEKNWDAVVLDVRLPGLSGLRALPQLLARRPELPIVVCSMMPEDPYAEAARRAGAAGFVRKDRIPEELVPTVLRLVRPGEPLPAKPAGEPVEVLLVEDDEEVAEAIRLLVEHLGGYRVAWASSYDAGLAALREKSYGACLLDFYLDGERTGLDLLRELQREGSSTPVVVLSGRGALYEREVLAAGASDYLVKGRVDAERLSRALRHAIERNRAIGALRERERLFRAVFDGAADAMVIVDADARCADANAAALELLGLPREELATLRIDELVDAGERSALAERWSSLVAGDAFGGEWRVGRADGEVREVTLRATANILPGRHLAILHELTAERRAEAMRARLAAIVESAEDAIIGKDLDGTVREWNPGAERVYGYSASEMIGSSILRLVPPSRLDEWRDIIAHVRRGEYVRGFETVRVRRDGGLIDVSIAISPIRDACGRLVGACTIARDITETKRLQARLAMSDRMASVGTLAAGIAHEINNPLGALIANVELAERALEKGGEIEELRECLDDAATAAHRVRVIVRDVKLFSRPDEERLAPVDVNGALRSTVRMVRNEIRHRALLVEEYGDVPRVDANESRLGQVFLNLLVNAAHAIPEGRAEQHKIRIASRAEREHVVVEITDSGRGIEPDNLSRIFDAFFTTKPQGVGTGLGLSICHGIVAALGGRIEVDSVLGKGSTFRVLLPVGRLKTIAPEPPKRPTSRPARQARVLLVDDDAAVVKALARLLRTTYDVEAVTDASTALARLASGERFDVIVSDLMMPELDGVMLFEALGDIAPELRARTVFVTGGAFTPRTRDFLASVTCPCLDKPVEHGHLIEVIDEIIEQSAR